MNDQVYLLLGSNMGERQKNLEVARDQLELQAGRIIGASRIYVTQAWGNTLQPEFLNQAIQIRTTHTPVELMAVILQIEKAMGRQRTSKWGARKIDIDILLWGQEKIELPNLQVPHPRMHERKFALVPLAEIAPDLLHPIFGKTVNELLLETQDTLAVRPESP